ncbi:3-oxoacyl-[acyl-carrier-protein] synthase III, chloroplastic-like [Chenopodium quinoa]|uniref:beta-ketoacyl-[acyl-carrier-protein] synthase III n=1 Tax=Chenopodium quinoa TaxID=63459 RepID=A0A803LF09_CHEQI|nr:3-oxoacyl-[acyl-carrier-protein] synthase III, chloroplastic-like [Chenopodium quinoa]
MSLVANVDFQHIMRFLNPNVNEKQNIMLSINGFGRRFSNICCKKPDIDVNSRLVNRGCKLVGCGSAVPKLQISNDDLSKFVETSDEWISTRTGIRKRRVLSGDDSMVGLAAEAARNALQMANVGPDDIDLILMCTSTPEDLFGSAPQVQKALGCSRSPLSYDITAACSGFLLGLVSAACHVRGGGFKNVLVIGADALSRFVDWTDRGTCILFGDAAGAVVVQACDSEEDGMFAFDLHSDGEGARHLNASLRHDEADAAISSNCAVAGFPPSRPSYSCINMNGKEVFRFAVRCVPQSIEAALQKAGLNGSNIDWLLLHQANQRIIDSVATRLEVPTERVLSNLANYGNTSAASIPLALDEAVRSGKVQPGHIIATSGFGAGLTWGSSIIRWG